MNSYNQNNLSALPTSIIYQPSCISSIPMSVEISDSWKNRGSGISASDHAMRAAFGEYFERRHFYMEIYPDTSGTLDTTLSRNEVEKFTFAFAQTAAKKISKSSIRQHTFNLTRVYRCSDFSSCCIPSACLSLSAHNIKSDLPLYPLRDTCGCCFHSDPGLAILGSLKEQLERQFLAKFWLTKKCKKIINQQEATKKLKNLDSYDLYKQLCLSGEVTIIDISDQDFPGKCVLTVYGNSDPTRHVKYCAGMAYAVTAEEALDKSILELWQTYRFMDLHSATQRSTIDIEDPYLKYFLNCNSYHTYQNITDVEALTLEPSNSSSEFSVDGLLSALRARGIKGFIYIKTITIENDNFYATKYISPDLFLHMNNSQNINMKNIYSRSFLHQIHIDRKNIMVPFP